VLSRSLAQRYHYPAIDVLQSISRLAPAVSGPETKKAVGIVRRLMADYADSEDLINVGAYKQGSNPHIDEAIAKRDALENFLIQDVDEKSRIDETLNAMGEIAGVEIPEDEMEVFLPRLLYTPPAGDPEPDPEPAAIPAMAAIPKPAAAPEIPAMSEPKPAEVPDIANIIEETVEAKISDTVETAPAPLPLVQDIIQEEESADAPVSGIPEPAAVQEPAAAPETPVSEAAAPSATEADEVVEPPPPEEEAPAENETSGTSLDELPDLPLMDF
jgi:hypothetical protein